MRNVPVLTLLLFVFLLGCTPLADGDVWWHLRTGQLIVERGSPPQYDWFTYTNPDARWIDLSWGWQLASLGPWAIGGSAGLVLFKCLLGVTAIGILLLGTARGRIPPWATALIAIPPVMLFALRYPVRPEMISFVFLSAMLWTCYCLPARPRLVWLLPAIQLLWVNSHGSFVLGIVVIACFLCQSLVVRIWPSLHRGQCVRSHWQTWMLGAAMSSLACFANPYGLEGVLFPKVLYARLDSSDSGAFYEQLASEFTGVLWWFRECGWASIRLPGIWLVIVVTAGGLASFVPLVVSRKVDVGRLLLFALFTFLGWQAVKNLPYMALVSLAIVHWNLADLRVAVHGRTQPEGARLDLAATALITALIITVPTNVYCRIIHQGLEKKEFGLGEAPGEYPHDEARFLGQEGMPKRVYAAGHTMASAFIFHNGPERKVFVDSRLEVSSRETFERFLRIWETLQRHSTEAETLLLSTHAGHEPAEMPALLIDMDHYVHFEALLANPRWRPVFHGETAVVFLYEPDARRLGVNAVDANRLRIALYSKAVKDDPLSAIGHFRLGAALMERDPTAARESFKRAIELKPDFAEAHYNLAYVVEAREPRLAAEHYQQAIALDPAHADAHVNYGSVLVQQGHLGQALHHYRQALQVDPKNRAARRNLEFLRDVARRDSDGS